MNVAMHHLVQDEFQAKHLARGGHLVGPEGLKKGRSQSQIDYFSDGSEGRYIVTRRRSKVSISGFPMEIKTKIRYLIIYVVII